MAIRCSSEFGHYKQNYSEIYLLEVGGGLAAKNAKVAKKEIGFGVLNHERHETHEIVAQKFS